MPIDWDSVGGGGGAAPKQGGGINWDTVGAPTPEGRRPYVDRFKAAGHEVMQDVRQASAPPPTDLGGQIKSAIDQQNPWHAVKFGLDLLNVPLAGVGGTAEHAANFAQRKTGLSPAEVNLPPAVRTALQLMNPSAGQALDAWNRQARTGSFARHVGDVAEMAVPIPGAQELEIGADALRVGKLARELNVPRSVAKAMLEQGKGVRPPVLSPRLKAAGELEGKGHRVLGQRPEVAQDNWTRYTYNHALEPIGVKLPHNAPVGTEGYAKLQQIARKAYDDANVGAKGSYDIKLRRYMKQLLPARAMQDRIEPKTLREYNKWVTRIERRFDNQKNMTGAQAGKIISDLRARAGKLRRIGGEQNNVLADMLSSGTVGGKTQPSLVAALRENLHTYSSPETVKKLEAADQAYSRVMRIRDATRAAKQNGGRFTPSQLMTAADQGARRAGSSEAMAQGRAVMQHQAQVGHHALQQQEKSFAHRALERAPFWLGGGLAGHHFGHGLPFEMGALAGAGASDFISRALPGSLRPRPGAISGPVERGRLAKVATSEMGGRRRVLPKGAGPAAAAAGVEREQEQ